MLPLLLSPRAVADLAMIDPVLARLVPVSVAPAAPLFRRGPRLGRRALGLGVRRRALVAVHLLVRGGLLALGLFRRGELGLVGFLALALGALGLGELVCVLVLFFIFKGKKKRSGLFQKKQRAE